MQPSVTGRIQHQRKHIVRSPVHVSEVWTHVSVVSRWGHTTTELMIFPSYFCSYKPWDFEHSCTHAKISLENIPGNGYVRHGLNAFTDLQDDASRVVLTHSPTSSVYESLWLHILVSVWFLTPYFYHNSVCEMGSHCGLNLIFV